MRFDDLLITNGIEIGVLKALVGRHSVVGIELQHRLQEASELRINLCIFKLFLEKASLLSIGFCRAFQEFAHILFGLALLYEGHV